jgi:hypothetical protein
MIFAPVARIHLKLPSGAIQTFIVVFNSLKEKYSTHLEIQRNGGKMSDDDSECPVVQQRRGRI